MILNGEMLGNIFPGKTAGERAARLLIESCLPRVLHYHFDIAPMPDKRPRVVSSKGANRRVFAFIPPEVVNYRKAINYCANTARERINIPAPYIVVSAYYFEPLKSVVQDHPVSPRHGDLDNLNKNLFDALFGEGKKFDDDRNIVGSLEFKRFIRPGEKPGIDIFVMSIDECEEEML